MSVFQNELGGCPPNAKMMSECKRDYEQDIARVKEQEQASVNLSEALVGYLGFFGRGERQFTLTSLYGALLLEQLSLSETVINLQEQWAKEKQT